MVMRGYIGRSYSQLGVESLIQRRIVGDGAQPSPSMSDDTADTYGLLDGEPLIPFFKRCISHRPGGLRTHW